MNVEATTQVWQVDPSEPQPELIQKAAAIIRSGGLVAFPTETVYGLGANALDAEAVARIYQAKGRPANNPVIVHVAAVDEARSLAASWPDRAQLLAERFWPGPLTLVVPRSAHVPDIVAGGGKTLALRCPTHLVALALIRASRVPIAAPSANRSSELSPTRPEHVLRGLAGRISLLLDAGPTSAGIESTVIDLSGAAPRLLRPGPIAPGELEALLGPIDRPAQPVAPGDAPLPSPGLLARHYAPRTRLECWPTLEQVRLRALEVMAQGKSVGVVATEDPQLPGRVESIVLPPEPARFAPELFSALHDLDRAGLDCILAVLPPPEDAWLAVRDRLLRAATV